MTRSTREPFLSVSYRTNPHEGRQSLVDLRAPSIYPRENPMNAPADTTTPRRPRPGRTGVPSKRLVPVAEVTLFRRLFGARFREAREALGLTQPELAHQLGVSQGRIAHYETGRGLPRTYEIPALCRVLKCDPNFLLNVPQ